MEVGREVGRDSDDVPTGWELGTRDTGWEC